MRFYSLITVSCLLFGFLLSACSDKNYFNIAPEDYSYSTPVLLNDNIDVASIADIGADETALTEMVHNVLRYSYQDVDSVLVYKNNSLILEEYFRGYSQSQTHDLRSTTKSITSLLIGIAISESHLKDDTESIYAIFDDEYSGFDNWIPKKEKIQVQHLLNMNSGLDCNDDVSTSFGNETRMYRERDWYKFFLDLEMTNDPGGDFSYCTAGVNLLGGVIRTVTNMSLTDYSNSVLFDKLGITDFRWSTSPNGVESSGGHLYLRPRDMLKIGIMFLNNGMWQGQQIVPAEWINKSKQKTYPFYGYLWWKRTFRFPEEQNLPDMDAIYTSGNGGQIIYIVPGESLVAVFTGSNFNSFWGGFGPFLMMRDYIIPATH